MSNPDLEIGARRGASLAPASLGCKRSLRSIATRRLLAMYAVFVEVNATEAEVGAAREFLTRVAVPRAREHGAKGGYWLAAQGGRGVSIVVFETEDEARNAAAMFRVGEPPAQDAPGGVTVKTVEVREVLASV
jgi:hypothetical protein